MSGMRSLSRGPGAFSLWTGAVLLFALLLIGNAGAASLEELQRAAREELEALQRAPAAPAAPQPPPPAKTPAKEPAPPKPTAPAKKQEPAPKKTEQPKAPAKAPAKAPEKTPAKAPAKAPDKTPAKAPAKEQPKEQAKEQAKAEPAPKAVLPPPQPGQLRQALEGHYEPPAEFGSLAVLRACFSLAQLGGYSSEAKSTKLPEPDRIPPRRLESQRRLAPLVEHYRDSIRRVPPGIDIKPVALTFDLCERADERSGYDAAIVAYLREQAVPATFYAGGKWLRSHADRAKQLMADPLFEIGNHAWTHGNLRLLTGPRMRNQIVWTQGQYEELWEELQACARKAGVPEEELAKVPALPLTFRFPFGVCSAESLQVLADLGLPAVQWDVVSGDPAKNATPEAMAKAMREQTRPGSILIFHANGRGHRTAETLPLFVPWLREQGFTFVTVSQLLQLGRPESSPECYELKPGDNQRYDELFGAGE